MGLRLKSFLTKLKKVRPMRNQIETLIEIIKKKKKKKNPSSKSSSILGGIMVIKEKEKFIVLIGEAAERCTRGGFELRRMGGPVVETKEGLGRPAVEIGWFGLTGGGRRRRPGVTGWSWVSMLQLTEKSHKERERERERVHV